MGQYFFDFIRDGFRTADPEGIELSDDTAARIEASKALAEIASDTIQHTDHCRVTVEVHNEHNMVILCVGFVLTTEKGSE